ncbi:peptidylprolyl isomerase [Desulfovibrio litoralis]|uniref:Peptidyl-prolyl cis-trans isomerase n=1 Tax=Desulfovibrio litoralis DSM 11393 TaxID=1121455 RepID=A0A1M7TEA2_9BACT|nr:peptidylprolyl isomerase [Desulfovibrio litoralis]SHN69069.1 peptidyl-prolyl cis-trans isomerase B (cyclophilin B) [Desulfovibrio litoralis DSM 11393]
MSNPVVLMETSSGDILIELFEDKAPETVKNFLSYVDEGFYSNTIFHRVIKNFMIQGGGYSMRLEEKTTKAPIKNEADNGEKNLTGTIAMARTAAPHSATAQFYINVADNAFLDHRSTADSEYGYCVFGKVIDGIDNVNKIQKLKTKPQGMHDDVPTESVLITNVSRFEV